MRQIVRALHRHPAVPFCLLLLVGLLGIYQSLPIDLSPQSNLEWVDFVINLLIFAPSLLLALASGLLAVLFTAFPERFNEKNRISQVANVVLRWLGRPILSTSKWLLPRWCPYFIKLWAEGLVLLIIKGSSMVRALLNRVSTNRSRLPKIPPPPKHSPDGHVASPPRTGSPPKRPISRK